MDSSDLGDQAADVWFSKSLGRRTERIVNRSAGKKEGNVGDAVPQRIEVIPSLHDEGDFSAA